MATIRCPLYEAFEISANQAACVDGDRILSYSDLEREVCMMQARLLASTSIEAGDLVALQLPTSYFSLATMFALFRMKTLVVFISPREPAAAVHDAMEEVGSKELIDPTRLADLMGVEATPAAMHQAPEYEMNQPATLFFTSGSTGKAKAVVHGHRSHYYSARGANRNIQLRSGLRWLCSLPIHHVGGFAIFYRCIMAGACMVFPRRDKDVVEDVVHYQITHLSVVPTQLRRMLAHEQAILAAKHLQAVLLGGAPIDQGLVNQAREVGFRLNTTYGCTETASQVTTTMMGARVEMLMTAGAPLQHREVELADDGEILVKGRVLALGRWEGGEVVPMVDENGWYATGDLGVFEALEPDCLRVVGRKDNQFISGGENIQPEEIERVLLEEVEVLQAVVVPKPDEEFGARPVAFLEVAGAMPGDLAERLEKRLPKFKIPVSFEVLPVSDGLKVKRADLVEQLKA